MADQTPYRAPRRTAAQMDINIATGVPTPGANYYQTMRKPVSSDGMAESKTYNQQRAAGTCDTLTPTGFPDTKVNK